MERLSKGKKQKAFKRQKTKGLYKANWKGAEKAVYKVIHKEECKGIEKAVYKGDK